MAKADEVQGSVACTFGGEVLLLVSQKAAVWPSRRMLLLADVHLGKADHFRTQGIPVPWGPTERDLSRLTGLIETYGVQEVVVLGDLFHAAGSLSAEVVDAFCTWRIRHASTAVKLVRGNHDRYAGDVPATMGIEEVGEVWDVGALRLQHDPATASERPVVAGHVHPCVRMVEPATGKGVRLACFHAGAAVMVLPAFGTFTGMHPMKVGRGDRVYAVTPDGQGVLALGGEA